MDITEKEAFRLGFLARCAEEKLSGAALDARLEKAAESPVKFSPVDLGVPSLAAGGKSLLDSAWGMLGLPFGMSILAGGGLGYGTAKMLEPRVDEDEVKAQELMNTYKLYADKAKARKKVRQYRTGRSEL
jgi:hypothetical protein